MSFLAAEVDTHMLANSASWTTGCLNDIARATVCIEQRDKVTELESD